MLFAWITDPNAWLALGTLTLLEIVLGIDNIIFLSLVVAKLPTAQRNHARRIGLAAAMIMRLALLASIAWVTRLTNPLFELFGEAISARDLILLLGGLFLIWKASKEIHESIEGEEEGKTRVSSFLGAIVQIMLLDIIFSLDSVITAVGLSDHLFIMMAAVVIAVGVMMFAARPIGEFVDRHPSVKMLALSFLILVGFTLILESFDVHVPKGYIYFAMFFSIAVETLNLWRNKKIRSDEIHRSRKGRMPPHLPLLTV
jgi:predicted tellurium resistance membrane protein TerC